MDHHFTSARLRSLADQLLNDQLTPEEVGELDQLLLADPNAQQNMLDYCQFHALLAFDLRAQELVDRVVQTRQLQHQREIKYRPAASWLVGSPRQLLRTASWALAASVLLGATWLGFYKLAAPRVDMGPIASVSSSTRQLWPEITNVKIGAQTTELTLSGIGTVQLQGPTDFEIIGPLRARITKGRMKCRVTEVAGHGFVVETPYGEVTDLGTEFGVDMSTADSVGVMVFEGEVDVRTPVAAITESDKMFDEESEVVVQFADARRLVSGDGVVINASGEVDRLMSVFTGNDVTFCQTFDIQQQPQSVIVGVSDNLRSSDTYQFYEIVPGGLGEDSQAYVDRRLHRWSGLNASGMPTYLLGADYIKPFNNDKMRSDFQLDVTLSRPAVLYVFFDKRIKPPKWLARDFTDTGDEIGLNRVHPSSRGKGEGPGESTDYVYAVWKRVIPQAGTVSLGANYGQSDGTSMYGIAVTELD